MKANDDFEQAKKNQMEWISNIRGFLNDTEALKDDTSLSYKNSALGVWYYSKAKELYGDLVPFKKFEVKHIKLHKTTKEIIEAKNEGQIELSEELFDDLLANSDQIIELLDNTRELIIENNLINAAFDENIIHNSDKSVAWDKTKILMSTTDANGIIEYVNDVFLAISGYESSELIDKPHNIVRHPDMPKVVFKIIWDGLNQGKSSIAFIKNRAKSGKFYWVSVKFKVKRNNEGENESFKSTQKGIDIEIINKYIKPLYKQLYDIEQQSGLKSAENYLKGFLEERNRTFDDYTQNLLNTGKDSTNTGQKGFLSGIFG